MAEYTLGYLYYSTGDYDKAEPALMEACQAARSSGNEFVRQTSLGILGDIQRDRGRLNRAAALYRQALEEARLECAFLNRSGVQRAVVQRRL